MTGPWFKICCFNQMQLVLTIKNYSFGINQQSHAHSLNTLSFSLQVI